MKTEELIEQVWDYIVIGTGMGGGPLGLKLAQNGFSVLFLEKGLSPFESTSLKGQFAELFPYYNTSRAETLKKAGRFNEPIFDCTNSKIKKLEPFLGSGVGGSSALYGAVLERFKPSDFQNWPISYQTFSKYYLEAEKLFSVQASQIFHHPGNKKLSTYLQSQGLHPTHLLIACQQPMASVGQKICGNCQGILCATGCKNHSGNICIEPAMTNHRAQLLTECSVKKIETSNSGQCVTGVTALYQDQIVFFKTRHLILAAGALQSPLILQNSGIGKQEDVVGRNLMRHYVDLYALKIDSDPANPRAKELGFNDFYTMEGQTMGTVQSFGRLPPTEVLLQQMSRSLLDKDLFGLGYLFKIVRPLIKLFLEKLFSKRLVMASIVEDTPQPNNRVWSEKGKICLSYEISQEDLKKIKQMRNRLTALFKPLGLIAIHSAEKNEMLAHVCGTCRMGTDPSTSVVDTNNKVHGIDNLYVVDSSFFPTSGGTNPALTIAANSLRVAEILISKEKERTQRICLHT